MCDSEYDGRMIAATKNIESIFINLNFFEKKRSEDAIKVGQIMETLADYLQQIEKLTKQVSKLQAKLYEAGVR